MAADGPAPRTASSGRAHDPSQPAIAFDMPALPLEQALHLYGRITQQPALFSSDMIAGLVSSPVRGHHSAWDALRLLLAGTGLEVDRVDSLAGATFLLRPALPSQPDQAPATLELDGFAALLQSRVVQALCADGRTRPGNFRILFQLVLGVSDRLPSVRLLDSSGDDRRDAAVLSVLRQLDPGASPPPSFTGRPLTFAITPTQAGAAPPCG